MSTQNPHGLIDQSKLGYKNDYLYRITVKGLIINESGEVLVVKESGRTCWDLPGGGMDHGEDIKSAIARELNEEVNLNSNFTYKVIHVDDPVYLTNTNVLQIRLVFQIFPELMEFSEGADADIISFINPDSLKDSDNLLERRIYDYAKMASYMAVSS